MNIKFYIFALLVVLTASVSSLLAAPVTVSFQNNINGYTGARDARINAGAPAKNYGGDSTLQVDSLPARSSLLYWDITSIPRGCPVLSAAITIHVTDRSTHNFEIYALKWPWVENEVTWNSAAAGISWQKPGADGPADRDSTVLGALSGAVGQQTFTLNAAGRAALQSWVNEPATNFGFLVANYLTSPNGLDFIARERATVAAAPKLTITFDDSPILAIGDVTVTEGDAGTVDAEFAVTLSSPLAQTVTVDYATHDVSAAARFDYLAVSGQLIFAPGQTGKIITVPVFADSVHEVNEKFFVTLSNAVGVAIFDSLGEGTIMDDDPLPALSIDDVKVFEGAGPLVFLVSLSMRSGEDISVDFTTVNGSAVAPADYSALSGTLTIPAGYESGVVVFGNIGDFGDAGVDEENVANMLKAMAPEFIFTNGDNNYPDGEESTWYANVMQYYRDYVDAVNVNANRFYATLGNHDYHVYPSAYLNGLALPPGPGNERYYDIVKGPVHLFALDSNPEQPDGRDAASAQAQWLRAGLAASTSPWKIVFLHHAPFSSSTKHGSQRITQWPFEAWGADAVFAGHDHHYERLLRDDNGDSLTIPYFVNGLGGKSRYLIDQPIAGSIVRYNADYGAMFLRADSNGIIYEFHSLSDGIIDRYVTTRAGKPAPPQLVTVPIVNDAVFEAPETFAVMLSNPVNAVISDDTGEAAIIDDDVDSRTPIIYSFQDGKDGYAGTRDTKLRSSPAVANYGNDVLLEADGVPKKATLLYWDVSRIPPGSLVQSAAIVFNILDRSGDAYQLYELKRPWVESQATWNEYATGLSWEAPGADGNGDRGFTVLGSLSGGKGPATILLNSAGSEVVQSWVDNPAGNHGLVLLNYDVATNGIDMSSREDLAVSNRPRLVVTLWNGEAADSALSPGNPANKPPDEVSLSGSYPNPFNLTTRIVYSLPEESHVRLAVYNLRGQQIRVLVDDSQSAGYKTVEWNGQDDLGRDVSSGVYAMQLHVGHVRLVKKITLIK